MAAGRDTEGWGLLRGRGWPRVTGVSAVCPPGAEAAWHSSPPTPPQARSLFPRVSGGFAVPGDTWAGMGRSVPREVAASPQSRLRLQQLFCLDEFCGQRGQGPDPRDTGTRSRIPRESEL